jgi:hypothetical protein
MYINVLAPNWVTSFVAWIIWGSEKNYKKLSGNIQAKDIFTLVVSTEQCENRCSWLFLSPRPGWPKDDDNQYCESEGVILQYNTGCCIVFTDLRKLGNIKLSRIFLSTQTFAHFGVNVHRMDTPGSSGAVLAWLLSCSPFRSKLHFNW